MNLALHAQDLPLSTALTALRASSSQDLSVKVSLLIFLECIAPCDSCSSASECSSCQDGYFFDGSACLSCNPACVTCSSASTDSCPSCADNYYQPASSTSCLGKTCSLPACDVSCNGCSSSGNTNCLSCATGFFESTGSCLG